MNIGSLNLSCACSDEDDYFERLQVAYYALSYVNLKSIYNHVQKLFDIIIRNDTYIYIYIYDRMMVAITREYQMAKNTLKIHKDK